MAKVTVLKCDRCANWSSDQVTVRTVTVVGPRFDLCGPCREFLLVMTGVTPEKAKAYIAMVDTQAATPGVKPSLNAIPDTATPDATPADSSPTENGDDDEESDDTQEEAGGESPSDLISLPFPQSGPEEAPKPKPAPSRKRANAR